MKDQGLMWNIQTRNKMNPLACWQTTSRRAAFKWNNLTPAVRFPSPAHSSWKCVPSWSHTSPNDRSRTVSTTANSLNFILPNKTTGTLKANKGCTTLNFEFRYHFENHWSWKQANRNSRMNHLQAWCKRRGHLYTQQSIATYDLHAGR